MEYDILSRLRSSDYQIANKALVELLERGKMNFDDISTILSIEDKLVIGNFLIDYKHFDKEDLKNLQEYICANLDSPDRLFVSDLIEFATYWELELPYEKCISFLGKYDNDDDYVLLASIDYIFENLKLSYMEQICESLENILENPEQNQSSQIKAAFVLFRLTMKRKYLIDLIDLVVNEKNNKELLRNILNLKYNSQDYFDFHDMLKILCL